MTTEKRIADLEKQVSAHLAGRPVKVIWDRQGPTASGVGEVTKSFTNELIIYIAPLDDLKSRYEIWLHELSHLANNDHQFVTRGSATRPAASSKRTAQERADWRVDPRELAAQAQADEWLRYADRNKHKFWRAGRNEMECKLLALLEMDPSNVRPKGAIK